MSQRAIQRRVPIAIRLGVVTAAAGALLLPVASPRSAQADVGIGDLIYTDSNGLELRNGSTNVVTNLDATATQPDLSPDGSRIAFIDSRPPFYEQQLWVMNSDGSGVRQLIGDDGHATQDQAPRWSPDGRKIVFTKMDNARHYNLYSLDMVGSSGVTQLTTNNMSMGRFTWSPDSQRIVYSADYYGSVFTVMNANGSGKRPLVNAAKQYAGAQYNPEWSPDGTRIYYSSVPGSLRYYKSTDGFTTDSQITDNQLTTSSGDDYPVVTKDGSNILFVGQRNGCVCIYSVSSSGGTATVIVHASSSFSVAKAAYPTTAAKTMVALGDSVNAGDGINYQYYWDGSKWVKNGPDYPTWVNTSSALGQNYQICHQSANAAPFQRRQLPGLQHGLHRRLSPSGRARQTDLQ